MQLPASSRQSAAAAKTIIREITAAAATRLDQMYKTAAR
jgi:hypothetical protein